ncbi:MAG: (2Fe-2S)-binding protein [Betaproteobacteria bacterium]
MPRLLLTVNGRPHALDVPAEQTLVHLLRQDLGLTGTHVGCDTAQCGACTVLLDGQAVKSCNLLALQCDGRAVATVEGLAAPDGSLNPLQRAFSRCHGLQCGYCTPGMLMSATALLAEQPHPSEEQIVHALEGNLCRCTGYVNIVAAVREAAASSAA